MLDALTLFKCLADSSRLAILSGLAKEPMYAERIAQRLSLSPSTVSFHMKKLLAAELVTATREQYYTIYAIAPDVLSRTLHACIVPPALAELSLEEQREATYRQKVIQSFLRDGRLLSIPVQRKKRLIILDMVANRFEVNKRYPERDVNLIISELYDDFCTMRRELVGENLLAREQGIYWRTIKDDPTTPSADALPTA